MGGALARRARGQKTSKERSQTANMILVYMKETQRPQTPSTVAVALGIPRERAKKAMQRMAEDDRLLRTPAGYEAGPSVGTF